MPRPLLRNTFGLTYRKIPVVAIGREIYCDTALIIEALEYYFPPAEESKEGWGTVYPKFEGAEEWVYRGLVRGFASFWVDVSFSFLRYLVLILYRGIPAWGSKKGGGGKEKKPKETATLKSRVVHTH